jgi:hypothetical protein
MKVTFTIKAGTTPEAPFTVRVGESRGKPNWRVEGPFETVEAADAVSEGHKRDGRFASVSDAQGRPVSRWLTRN